MGAHRARQVVTWTSLATAMARSRPRRGRPPGSRRVGQRGPTSAPRSAERGQLDGLGGVAAQTVDVRRATASTQAGWRSKRQHVAEVGLRGDRCARTPSRGAPRRSSVSGSTRRFLGLRSLCTRQVRPTVSRRSWAVSATSASPARSDSLQCAKAAACRSTHSDRSAVNGRDGQRLRRGTCRLERRHRRQRRHQPAHVAAELGQAGRRSRVGSSTSPRSPSTKAVTSIAGTSARPGRAPHLEDVGHRHQPAHQPSAGPRRSRRRARRGRPGGRRCARPSARPPPRPGTSRPTSLRPAGSARGRAGHPGPDAATAPH